MAQLINLSEMDRAIEEALDLLAKEAASDFAKTMETWTTHRPSIEVTSTPKYRRVFIADRIYSYINYGTDVRRALLSRDWKSKTAPRIIGSGPGSGRVLKVSKKFYFNGIEARNFDEAIQERIEREVIDKVLGNMLNIIVETA